MRTFISLYFLIQSLLLGFFIIHIYHSFADVLDTFLLIIDILVVLISLWNLFRIKYNELLYFIIYLTFSIFVSLFVITLLVIGNGNFLLLLFRLLIHKKEYIIFLLFLFLLAQNYMNYLDYH